MRMLPPRESVLWLQLLLICSCHIVLPHRGAMGQPALLRRNIIKVRASGFLPFESDLLLPLGILRQLQAQDRASRLLPPSTRRRPKPKPKMKQQVRLERAQADAGIQMYNLIDDDGELLLNLRVHSETSNSNSKNNNNNNHLDALPQASQLEELATPWRPSKWRPTKRPSPAVTSSSPRPLPLHQYLSSNSFEQQQQQLTSPSPSALTQQRRMFGARQDWRSYQ
ncbi:uncharacterized protein LOC117793588 [Drosophila innubila]|uniref:uncharacterized protein LOC117793588 n=1 Tax=Drosophila innubila TaxID=198719 RepID=UPI00148C3818|nr:uncharacterized protein LOC117793588 [Drosophila innubila]